MSRPGRYPWHGTRDDPRYAGYWLVNRIIIRRRLRCQRDRKHTIGHCRNCGVHQ